MTFCVLLCWITQIHVWRPTGQNGWLVISTSVNTNEWILPAAFKSDNKKCPYASQTNELNIKAKIKEQNVHHRMQTTESRNQRFVFMAYCKRGAVFHTNKYFQWTQSAEQLNTRIIEFDSDLFQCERDLFSRLRPITTCGNEITGFRNSIIYSMGSSRKRVLNLNKRMSVTVTKAICFTGKKRQPKSFFG